LPSLSPAARPWLSSSFVYPEYIPTMISREERQYLWWLAATVWKDIGHILEMGPWLGGSTVCLAEGVCARRERPRHRLFTVDNFVWRRFMSDRANLTLEPGESFEHVFRRNVAPYGGLVETQAAWLPDEIVEGDCWAENVRGDGSRGNLFRWQDGPVEIAFVDGAKSWAGFAHLLAEVGPSLTPDSLLVLQDYKYWGSYWVPMMSELVADRLELVHALPANTITFRVTAPLEFDCDAALPDIDIGLALLERAASRLDLHADRLGANVVRLSGVRYLAHQGDTRGAVNLLRLTANARPLSCSFLDVDATHEWLETYTNTEIPMVRLSARLRWRSLARKARKAGRLSWQASPSSRLRARRRAAHRRQ
jgi:hypothetical protein